MRRRSAAGVHRWSVAILAALLVVLLSSPVPSAAPAAPVLTAAALRAAHVAAAETQPAPGRASQAAEGRFHAGRWPRRRLRLAAWPATAGAGGAVLRCASLRQATREDLELAVRAGGRRTWRLHERRGRGGALRAHRRGASDPRRPTSSSAARTATTASSRRARAELPGGPRRRTRACRRGRTTTSAWWPLQEAGSGGARTRRSRSSRPSSRSRPTTPLARLELGVGAGGSASAPRRRWPRSRSRRAREPRPVAHVRLPRPRAARGSTGRPRRWPPCRARWSWRAARERTRPRCCAIHLQLGQALRAAGPHEEAAAHFAESQRLSARGTRRRARAARPLPGRHAPIPTRRRPPALPAAGGVPLRGLAPPHAPSAGARCREASRARYLNLGILQAQAERFAARGRALRARRPPSTRRSRRSQSSLGIAYFNARRFDAGDRARSTRALAAQPGDAGLKRMLALAWLNTAGLREGGRAAGGRSGARHRPLAAVRVRPGAREERRAAEAEAIFAGLLRRPRRLGRAERAAGPGPRAAGRLRGGDRARSQRALRLQGRRGGGERDPGRHLPAAGPPRRKRSRRCAPSSPSHPADLRSQQQPRDRARVAAAAARRRSRLLRARRSRRSRTLPTRATCSARSCSRRARRAEAVEHLEAAARLAPEDASIRYQLGQAYQKLGRTEQARAAVRGRSESSRHEEQQAPTAGPAARPRRTASSAASRRPSERTWSAAHVLQGLRLSRRPRDRQLARPPSPRPGRSARARSDAPP